VKAQVLDLDSEKRRLKLGIKQMVPTSIDEYLAEHQAGDVVSGRVVEVSGSTAQVELGEGIRAACQVSSENKSQKDSTTKSSEDGKRDLASLTSMLQAHWKGGATVQSSKPSDIQAGQVRSFRITKIDRDAKKIEVDLQ
jgi:small subunit ribosomal protein S1